MTIRRKEWSTFDHQYYVARPLCPSEVLWCAIRTGRIWTQIRNDYRFRRRCCSAWTLQCGWTVMDGVQALLGPTHTLWSIDSRENY